MSVPVVLVCWSRALVASARCPDHPLAFIDAINLWPLCCLVVLAITYPITRRVQTQDPDYDPRKLVFYSCVAICALVGWLRWGDAGLC